MTKLLKFRDNINIYLNIDIEEDPLWEFIANNVRTDKHSFGTFTSAFAQSYQMLLGKEPKIAFLTNQLFVESILYCAKQPLEDTWWMNELSQLFHAWTQDGLHDITLPEANQLAPSLRPLLRNRNFHTKTNETVMGMVFLSEALWVVLKPDILASSLPHHHKPFSLDARVFHRHEPTFLGIKQEGILEFYKFLYFTASLFKTPTLLQLSGMLKGAHHNCLAWSIAFEECVSQKAAIGQDWMQMLPIFSSLALDPTEPAAWHFWHLLSEFTKYNDSGQELMISLTSIKEKMSQSFSDIWSIVDTLEEGDARYMHAASLVSHSDSLQILKIPEYRECSLS